MTTDNSTSPWLPELRRRVIDRPDEAAAKSTAEFAEMDLSVLVQELRIHQVELEVQNEDLRQAQRDLTDARDEYRQLYEQAPVGYLTVDPRGNVRRANSTALEMLQQPWTALVGQPFHSFVDPADQDRSFLFMRGALGSEEPTSDELRLPIAGQEPLWVAVNAVRATEDGQRRIRVTLTDVTERKRAASSLIEQATHDALTGLVNRIGFKSSVEQRLTQLRGSEDIDALLYLDLDQFKVINDTAGHPAGDALLVEVTELLRSQAGRKGTVARLGGDEFAVLVERTSLEQAEALAHTIRAAIEDYRFEWEKSVFPISASIGVIGIDGRTRDYETLLSAVDAACFAAKDAGRNQVRPYREGDPGLRRQQQEMQWVARVDSALADGRLEPWGQPIVPVSDSEPAVLRFEVLLRLLSRDGTVVRPGEFMPAVERYGLAGRVDRFVTGAVLDWLEENQGRPGFPACAFINLSGHSMTDQGLLEWLVGAIQQRDLPASHICFEVTESAVIADMRSAVEFMQLLRAIGCSFALDDFGSGLSSFRYLRALPVDIIKIDGAFVKDMLTDPVALAFVRVISELATTMGKQTIAEFVEDRSALAVLDELGVDYAQGYGIARPSPLSRWQH